MEVDLFPLKLHLNKVVPINHSWRQKTRDTGLSDGEDRIFLRSVVLTQYRSVMDGQTDKQMNGRNCRSIHVYNACKSSFAGRLKEPKTEPSEKNV